MTLVAIVVSDRALKAGETMLGWQVAIARMPFEVGGDAVSRAAAVRGAAHALRNGVLRERCGASVAAPAAFRAATPDGTYCSLSHTRGAVAVAVAADPVGIDIEPAGPAPDARRLAARFFAADEQDDDAGFVWRWTAKEALMKAGGLTLRAALQSSVGPPAEPPFTREVAGRTLSVFPPLAGFALSVARGSGQECENSSFP